MLDEHVDGLVRQGGKEVGGPVVLRLLAVAGVEHLLQRDVGHGLHHVEGRGAELQQGPHHLAALVDGADVAEHFGQDRIPAHRLGHELLPRSGDERQSAADLVGALSMKSLQKRTRSPAIAAG